MEIHEKNGQPEVYIMWEENSKADLETIEYFYGLDLLGTKYKKVVSSCEHCNEVAGYTQLHTPPIHLVSWD